jgi:endonuclease I
MKPFKAALIVLAISWNLSAFNSIAQIPEGYYAGTEDLGGSALKEALYQIIKNHTEFPYTSTGTDVWDILKETDKDTVNPDNIILLYSGWSVNAAQEYNNENGWSREHVWAKSHGDFGTETGPGTDVHALRPADITVNEKRSNMDFADGGEIYIDADGPTECRYTSNSWEPRDEVKGDVARMIFYMAVRYEGENNEPDLEPVDYVNASPNYEPLHGKLSDLLRWHKEDPPNDWERNRNDIIYYQYQHNRNPFIDHPDFADKIYGGMVSTIMIDTEEKFSLYPNPASNILYIRINQKGLIAKKLKIELYDNSGKPKIIAHPDTNLISLPINKLKNGIYHLHIYYLKENIFQQKIIIE